MVPIFDHFDPVVFHLSLCSPQEIRKQRLPPLISLHKAQQAKESAYAHCACTPHKTPGCFFLSGLSEIGNNPYFLWSLFIKAVLSIKATTPPPPPPSLKKLKTNMATFATTPVSSIPSSKQPRDIMHRRRARQLATCVPTPYGTIPKRRQRRQKSGSPPPTSKVSSRTVLHCFCFSFCLRGGTCVYISKVLFINHRPDANTASAT